jgi:hypothetical protein
VNTVQLTYAAGNLQNIGLAWYVNTAYILQATNQGSTFQTFADTSVVLVESLTIAIGTNHIQQVSTLPVVGIAGN